MRSIKKSEPKNNLLLEMIEKYGIPTTDVQATKYWSKFKDKRDHLLHKQLKEQYGLCCYTELNISDMNSDFQYGCHFEHIEPKSKYPEKTFEENNIVCSALSSEDLKSFKGRESFGGHYKESDFDPILFISPTDQNCGDHFLYLHDGSVVPAHSEITNKSQYEREIYTIKLLNLNARFLKTERSRWIMEIQKEIDDIMEGEDENNCMSAIRCIAECELTTTDRSYPKSIQIQKFPQLRSFHSATKKIFGKIGDEVVNEHCPDI